MLGLLTQEAVNFSPEDPWAGVFFGIEAEHRFVLLIIIIGCLTVMTIAVAGIFTGLAATMHRRANEDRLKRELLDRGMSAEEIARIVEATPPTDFLERWASHRGKRLGR